MRDLKNNLISPGKGSTNIQSLRTKSFGYQILGFGSGGGPSTVDFDYLIVAGGGGTVGGLSAGGGAGGFRTSYPGGTKIALGSGATITVGDGGTASPAYPVEEANLTAARGSNSEIIGDSVTITSAGGGVMNYSAGDPGTPANSAENAVFRDGGSGAGTGHQGTYPGAGNVPPSSGDLNPVQGYPGGPGGGSYGSSGGGGASGAGSNGSTPGAPPNNSGPGGAGSPNLIAPGYPLGTTYAGGGGGGGYGGSGGTGGAGGGGNGGTPPTGVGIDGTDGLGGGGGGTSSGPNNPVTKAGGNGVVFLRVATADAPAVAVTPGTNTVATDGSDKVCTFTVSGTVTF